MESDGLKKIVLKDLERILANALCLHVFYFNDPRIKVKLNSERRDHEQILQSISLHTQKSCQSAVKKNCLKNIYRKGRR